MSPILHSAIVLTAVVLYLPVVFANYADTCKDEHLSGQDLVATCTAEDGSQQSTTLYLSACVANYGGHLACVVNGGFAETCDVGSCVLTGGETLQCSCGNGHHGHTTSTVDLGSCINNNNGMLQC